MAVHCGKHWEDLPSHLTHVVVVNLDIAGSSLIPRGLASKRDLLIAVNDLQDKIQSVFIKTDEADDWLVGEWSGDGLVALYLDPRPEPRPAVDAAIKIAGIVGDWRKSTERTYTLPPDTLRDVDVRIGVCSGLIIWSPNVTPMTGRIIAPVMNEAGHLQKECDPGRVLIDKETYDYLGGLRRSFPDDLKRTVKHGATALAAYVYQDASSVKAPALGETIDEQIWAALSKCQRVAKAPGACYFFGEFAVMFGHMALIQPIPLYTYVGAKVQGASKRETKIELEAGYAVKPTIDLYDTAIRNSLRVNEDFEPVGWDDDEVAQINKIARAVLGDRAGTYKLVIYSLIPNKCGLNASSAISIALSGVLIPGQLREMRHRVLSAADNTPFYGDSGDELIKLIRTAWAFDNVFHGGSSSGCGLTAASMGSLDGWPIIYVAESRGFQGPYPIVFEVLHENLMDRSWEPLRRIRFVAHRAKAIREDGATTTGDRHQFALFHIGKRVNDLSTNGIIKQFLHATHVSGEIVNDLKKSLNSPGRAMHKYYLPTKLIGDALELSEYGNTGSFRPRLGDDIPRVSEKLVESLAEALGACALSGISSFTARDFDDEHWINFAQCVNAYQELMCACGVSQPLADLFNYRSDAFSYEFTEMDERKKRLPYGTKLTGAGKGGDFLVLAPKPHLSANFPRFRHEVRIDRKPLWCHFASWAGPDATHGAQLLRPE